MKITALRDRKKNTLTAQDYDDERCGNEVTVNGQTMTIDEFRTRQIGKGSKRNRGLGMYATRKEEAINDDT